MRTLPLIGLLVACCATSTLWAAEPAPAKPAAAPAATPAPAPATPAAAESATPKSDEDSNAKEADEGEEKQAAGKPKATAADKAGDKASPQRFVPSEQVRADFDVSFPIDI
jgi:hypothetical protein